MKRLRWGLAAQLALVLILFAAGLLAALGGLAYADGRASLEAAIESELPAQALATVKSDCRPALLPVVPATRPAVGGQPARAAIAEAARDSSKQHRSLGSDEGEA